MPRKHDPALKEQARALRLEGRTVPDIAEAVGVAKSTAYVWTRELPVPPRSAEGEARRIAAHRAHYALRGQQRDERHRLESLAWADSLGTLTEREVLIVGAAIYWAEEQSRSHGACRTR